jgi:hypothetical protein
MAKRVRVGWDGGWCGRGVGGGEWNGAGWCATMQAIPNVAGKVARRLHARCSGVGQLEGVAWQGFVADARTGV